MKPILAIEEGEDIFLPKKYHKINNLCAIIYDQLTEIYKEYNYKELSHTTIDFKDNSKLVQELKKDKIHILDWLKANELNNEIEIIITKQIVLAVVSDFINFMFESMYCAKRGKMTVAYALLRKPITDELLIFEQLLGDRKEFINRFFHSGNPVDYDPSDKNLDKKTIIQRAIDKLRINFFFSSGFIYNLRYNKSFDAGINGISNHALHIVTKDKYYKTPEQNLNLVFSNESAIDRYYEHYYNLVPYLLIYSVSVIDELIFGLLTDDDNQNLKTVKEFRRLIGLILLTEYTNITHKKENKSLFNELTKELVLVCPKCGKENKVERVDCELFFEIETFLCANCFESLMSTKESVKILENALIKK
ncbi:MAG: hypothetical protein AB9833_07755 [Bacteroidales bacterium]